MPNAAMLRPIALVLALTLAGCSLTPPPPPAPQTPQEAARAERARAAVATFLGVVDRVEPVAEAFCTREAPDLDCDFIILVDRDPTAPPNAFQTTNRRGQPLIIFTVALIAEAENPDQLAFVMGHETAHHIARHISLQDAEAADGARIFSDLARASGADARTVAEAAQIGSIVASRRFSQGAELEADAIGTVIAHGAGYDPVRGADFFRRLPDPSGRFLSTHPPNAARFATVRRIAAELGPVAPVRP